MRVQQPTIKQEPRHDPQQQKHENQNPNNILSGDQPLQVLSYQLEELKQTNLNLLVDISIYSKDFLAQVDT